MPTLTSKNTNFNLIPMHQKNKNAWETVSQTGIACHHWPVL